ncbi:hypothetical protein ACJX0J_011491, partial [Zea mays]
MPIFRTFYMQEKYEANVAALSQMEKRAVMAETMLEATKQYQAGQFISCRCSWEDKSRTKPRYVNKRINLLSRGLGWLDKNKETGELESCRHSAKITPHKLYK